MKDRLKEIIEYYGITPNAFSQKIGVSEGAIRKILKENTTLRSDNLEKIAQTFTNIDLHWLITGQGSMFLKERPSEPQEQPSDNALQMIAKLARENGQLQAEILELKKENARLASAPDASVLTA